MGMKRLNDGVGPWYGEFMAEGRRKGSLLCKWTDTQMEPKNAKEATIAFEAFKGAVRSGSAFLKKPIGRKMSVAQFVEYYIANYWNEEVRTANGAMGVMNIIKEYFGAQPLSVLGEASALVEFKTWLKKTPIDTFKRTKDSAGAWQMEKSPSKRMRTNGTITAYRARLCHMCSYAKAFDLIEANPFLDDKIKKFWTVGDKVGRKRGVSVAEEKALFAHASSRMTERIEVGITLGPRLGEMLRAQLEEIDFKDWTWTFPGFKTLNGKKVRNTKTGKDRTVPIPVSLQPLFTKKRTLFSPKAFLFGRDGKQVKSVKHPWEVIKERAKLDDLTLEKAGKPALHWHDLRGEAGTRMLRKGFSAEIVAEILGNTPEVLRANYQGDLLDAMRRAVNG